MSDRLLPFESAFRQWVEERGMEWRELTSSCLSGFHLLPVGPPERAVFALHGAGNDALFGWVGLFKDLLLAGSEVFTFDLPGHGRRTDDTFDSETAVRKVHSAYRTFAGVAGSVPLHALGVSLGGSLLLSALPDLEPAPASAAILVAPLRIVLSGRTLLPEIGVATLSTVWREREHYGLTGLIPSFGPFRRDLYPLRLSEAPPRGMFGYVESLNRALERLDLEPAAARIPLPVLLGYGTRDRVVPIEQAERLAALLPRGELMRVRGGTHLSTPLDHRLRERVVGWMRGHDGIAR